MEATQRKVKDHGEEGRVVMGRGGNRLKRR